MTTSDHPAAGGAVTAPETTTAPSPSTHEETPTTQRPAAEGQEEPSGEPAETGDDKSAEQQGKPKQKFHERLSRVIRERNEARAEVARLSQPIRPRNIDELDYDARERLRVREALRDERKEEAGQQATHLDQEYRSERNTSIQSAIQDAADRIPGLWEKFARQTESGEFVVKVSEFGADFLAESSKTAELAAYLADNPKEALRIAKLPVHRQGIEFGRLEERVSRATPRKASTAPNPGTTLKGGSPPSAAKLSELAENDNMAEYIAARKAAWNKGGH